LASTSSGDAAIVDHVGALLHRHRLAPRVMASTPSISTLVQLLDEGQHRVDLAGKLRQLLVLHRVRASVRDMAGGGSVNGTYG